MPHKRRFLCCKLHVNFVLPSSVHATTLSDYCAYAVPASISEHIKKLKIIVHRYPISLHLLQISTNVHNKMVCNSCSMAIVSGEAVIACEGYCKGSFHAKCVKLSTDEKISCIKNPFIFWICISCSKVLRETRYSDYMQNKYKSISSETNRTPEESDSAQQFAAYESIDAIAEIKTEIASIQNTLADLTAFRQSVLNTTTNNEQPLAHSSPAPSTSSNSMHGCCVGNGTRAIPWLINNANYRPNSNEKFWMFFSRVKNDVTEDEIRAMVSECLETTESITVQKLVSTWVDATQLPYISFKVGIDVKLRNRAMLSSTWPSGVWFREFRERNFTWQPRTR